MLTVFMLGVVLGDSLRWGYKSNLRRRLKMHNYVSVIARHCANGPTHSSGAPIVPITFMWMCEYIWQQAHGVLYRTAQTSLIMGLGPHRKWELCCEHGKILINFERECFHS